MYPSTVYPSRSFILSKIESLKARIELLTGLNKVVAAKDYANISDHQWYAINNQLNVVAYKISQQLGICINTHLMNAGYGNQQYKLINALGEIELQLSKAYNFYDTYMDILTQRLSPVLGQLLKGCDAIAADGLKNKYLTSVVREPIVYCQRGFGASIIRQEVRIAETTNPVAFIAIPYSRLAEKYNLISIYHEVGHQALNKLDLIKPFQEVFAIAVKNAGGNQLLQNMFSNWSREIIPDFWAFGHTGKGQTSSMRDVLLVPQVMAFSISPYQQHPPSYLRFLISVEWCRFLWGRGDWDHWYDEWISFYPTQTLDAVTKEIIMQAKKVLPNVARAMITTRFKKLNHRSIASMFDMSSITPGNLKKCSNKAHFLKQPIGVQLSVFRLMRDEIDRPIAELNKIMHSWLLSLNNQKSINHN